VALFRKKSEKPEDGGEDKAPEAEGFQPQPEKAQKWFNHAKAMADSYSYDAALSYYDRGIKLDPEAMSAHDAMYEAAVQYLNRGGKPASSKERRVIEDNTTVGKFAAAEFEWMKNIRDPQLGLKAVEAAAKAELHEVGYWLATKMLTLVRSSKKVNKAMLVRAKDVFAKVGAWDEAITCGELALQMDPTDGDLSAELKNLAAQRTMDRGGYEAAGGEEGGFRRMTRDADKQRELEEAESIAGGASVEERNLARAREAYEENPTMPDAINRYAQLLKKSGDPEQQEQAYKLYMKGYEDTNEYRFRMMAGDIRIDQLRRKEKELANTQDSEELQQVREQRRRLQAKEYRERVERYPTDRNLKFQLGTLLFELGEYEEAMGCFQAAKDEPKLRVRAGHLLGKCFAAESWHAEAIAEYREALDAIDATEKERELDIRYDLMASLIEEARSEQSEEMAKEAKEICSSIARRDITYRDIRAKRKQIDELQKQVAGE